MKKDMNQMLIEVTIRRTLQHIKESPERAIRNLVDLGLEFSNGRFQKRFLETTQTMLSNQESAYYTLVSDVINSVDPDILTTFGVNLGYNGCTKGANIIRQMEAERGYNIPWSLAVTVNEDKMDSDPEFYSDLLQQSVSLGIHTFLIFTVGNPVNLIPLIQSGPNCAFILFLRGHQITDSFLEKMKEIKHVMFAVYDDEDMPFACKKLRNANQLYSVYLRYTKDDRERILNGEWLSSLLPIHPACAILRTDEYDAHELNQSIYDYVMSVRNEQQYPFILMDMKYDVMAIDKVISDGECAVGFDADGNLRTHEGIVEDELYNIFSHSLEDILKTIEMANRMS